MTEINEIRQQMKKTLTVSLALILALALCAPALAEITPVDAAPPPAVTDTPAATDSVSWQNPTPEQAEETLALYQRFVALCQARGETISDAAFATDPDVATDFLVVYLPMEGVKFTGVPAGRFYTLNIYDLTGIGWERHRALWADLVRAIDPAADAARATQIIDTAWEELTESHPGTGVMEGHFEEGAWGYTGIKYPDDSNQSMLMAAPKTEPVEGGLPFSGPLVLHFTPPRPEDPRVAERRATFCSLIEALGMALLPDEEPVEAEIDGFVYSCYLVTDTVEWTDLLDPEDGTPLAHYALHKGQDATKEGVSDLTRGVLQAAVVAVADIAEEEAAALITTLIASLEEEAEDGALVSTIDTEDGRTVVLRSDGEIWFVLVSCDD